MANNRARTYIYTRTQRYLRGCNLTLHRVYVNNEWERVSVISGAQHRVLDVGGVVVFIAARRRVLLSARSLKYLNTTPEFQPLLSQFGEAIRDPRKSLSAKFKRIINVHN